MTIDDYIAALRLAIRSLPPDEIDQALAYYDEYLHDASNPAAAMAELGTPKEVAASILADYVGKTSSRPNISVLWAVILGILAVPLGGPLAIVAFVIMFALLIALFAVIFALLGSGVGIGLGGIGLFVAGFFVIYQGVSTALIMIGVGALMAAFGLLWTFGIIQLARLGVAGFARLVVKITRK